MSCIDTTLYAKLAFVLN